MRTGTPQNPNFGLGIWLGEPYRERRGFGAPGTAGPQVLHSEAYLDRLRWVAAEIMPAVRD